MTIIQSALVFYSACQPEPKFNEIFLVPRFHRIILIWLQSTSRIWASQICICWFDFRLEPIYTTAPSASKTMLNLKSGQIWLKYVVISHHNLNP